ncbi:MAG: Uma2 family endonuclease [Candidatus Sumerlaeia bacterium]|nr:Uma2 family endonuclease [Candidatus Sumerlaeia bacterium]
MSSPVKTVDVNRRYTYADYLTWPEGERWELIDGVPYAMSPAPSVEHQTIQGNLLREFFSYFRKESPCKVFASPIDVRLFPELDEDETDVVVQPDVIVVCDPTKLGKKAILGAPDLVVEILSPSSVENDTLRKKALYERAGVKQYWIVNPEARHLSVLLLKNGILELQRVYEGEQVVEVPGYQDFKVALNDVFPAAGK